MATKEEILAAIKNMTVLELSDLVKELESYRASLGQLGHGRDKWRGWCGCPRSNQRYRGIRCYQYHCHTEWRD